MLSNLFFFPPRKLSFLHPLPIFLLGGIVLYGIFFFLKSLDIGFRDCKYILFCHSLITLVMVPFSEQKSLLLLQSNPSCSICVLEVL